MYIYPMCVCVCVMYICIYLYLDIHSHVFLKKLIYSSSVDFDCFFSLIVGLKRVFVQTWSETMDP